MPNRLSRESSPYLLQHAANPVDWHAWGPEALGLAKQLGRPIFLSIGYSACHWCHVMEHESFEDPRIAALMNEHFVCIKVDREERPDLDQVYMTAVQIMTGRGGWPMSVFLTPDLQPFFGGTYWPPQSRHGLPGFDQVLLAVSEAWRERRQQAIDQAADLTEHLQQMSQPPAMAGEPSVAMIEGAASALARTFDSRHGGFGGAPKFPHPLELRLLLRDWRRTGNPRSLSMVRLSLDRMAAGGMYDHLAGGFHRYSVDERWLVPHFEKMLYDNALLTSTYIDAFLATGSADYARTAREVCDYVLTEMTDSAGGFYSTQDADSEGEEGKFFVWTPAEIESILGPAAAQTFSSIYDVTSGGNFEGHNILNLPQSIEDWAPQLQRDPAELRSELDASRAKLLVQRRKRVPPGLDDKVLVSWNGLMIAALAEAGAALAEPRYIAAARRAADFLLAHLRDADGRLLHSWRHGQARLPAYLDDYAGLAAALVALYQATFDERYLDEACQLADTLLTDFADTPSADITPGAGGFYYTAAGLEQPLGRMKDFFDNATPSGNSLAATALGQLALLTGREDFARATQQIFTAAMTVLTRQPGAAGQLLLALDLYLGPTAQLVIVGDPAAVETASILTDLRTKFLPNKVIALRADPQQGTAELIELFAGREAMGGRPTLYVCQGFACQAPAVGHEAARAALAKLTQPSAG